MSVEEYVNGMMEEVHTADTDWASSNGVAIEEGLMIPVNIPRDAITNYVNTHHVVSIELAKELCRRFDNFNSGLPGGNAEGLKINFFMPEQGLFQVGTEINGITHMWRLDSDGNMRKKNRKSVQGKKSKIEEDEPPAEGTVSVSELDGMLANLRVTGGGKRKSRRRPRKSKKTKSRRRRR
jgi:hypothetical protein